MVKRRSPPSVMVISALMWVLVGLLLERIPQVRDFRPLVYLAQLQLVLPSVDHHQVDIKGNWPFESNLKICKFWSAFPLSSKFGKQLDRGQSKAVRIESMFTAMAPARVKRQLQSAAAKRASHTIHG
ncbi:unnamed protein product [Cladocopium goreaui]|uniref:Uncharacterized protein n=1 Tax=Cladocopium goreaui TaxID=2562237 RepID=A0A9P1GPR3_9DINO|nr:unnamed protein product [Cladocopium goreaui]